MGAEGRGRLFKESGYEREPDHWYVDEPWVSALLFAAFRDFAPLICDPCAGSGNIPKSARSFGYDVVSMDLRDRGYIALDRVGNFLGMTDLPRGAAGVADFVFNPPYDRGVLAIDFIRHALTLTRRYVAAVVTESFLASEDRYLDFTEGLPLARVWVLSSRPSMPPGGRGIKPTGGQTNYHWHLYDRLHPPGAPWLGGHLIRPDVLLTMRKAAGQ
ncbi:hypothetical protein [Pacificispira sp.]|uniref:hypothetical protein n=1 Tax=Pacificispira sp. TaxID=2888761 RepID=UPI003BA8C285